MRYKHIIFDIDGTLIDTEYAVIHSLIKTITKITGNVPQYEDLKFVLGITGKDALKRLKIDDIDSLFSLRLDGTLRIFGIRKQNYLQILWVDQNHEVCPSKKKHT